MIACWLCNQTGCDNCRDGYVVLNECPKEFIGNDIMQAVNIAALCTNGVLPVSGALLDQSAWFVDLWSYLQSAENQIQFEQSQRASK